MPLSGAIKRRRRAPIFFELTGWSTKGRRTVKAESDGLNAMLSSAIFPFQAQKSIVQLVCIIT
jgi:hypothetical protein